MFSTVISAFEADLRLMIRLGNNNGKLNTDATRALFFALMANAELKVKMAMLFKLNRPIVIRYSERCGMDWGKKKFIRKNSKTMKRPLIKI